MVTQIDYTHGASHPNFLVGSDEFLMQNIELLRAQGMKPEQIMLDKRQQQLAEFLAN